MQEWKIYIDGREGNEGKRGEGGRGHGERGKDAVENLYALGGGSVKLFFVHKKTRQSRWK